MSKDKRMAFFEIGKGRFAQWMQEEFERAQRIARESGVEIKITSVISIKPPAKEDENFGQVSFAVKVIRPSKKSMEYTTELRDGMIVSDGEDIGEILQESLDFPEISGRKEGTNGNG